VLGRYSDNPVAAKNGGSLGVVRWETAPHFLRTAMFKLKPGQIGDEVQESPFGFHIYQRLK
jgi:parvulin-like peptidyl-prolyl isomerase